MSKLERLYNTSKFRPLADAWPALIEDQRREQAKGHYLPITIGNDDLQDRPKGFPQEKEREKETLPQSGLGTYDTVKLTSLGVGITDLRNPGDWSIGKGSTLDSIEAGEPTALSKILYLDREGREVMKGEHHATVGIDFKPNGGRIGGQVVGDLLVVNVPSPAAMMYADPLHPLVPEDVEAFMARLQEAVSHHVHCDLMPFKVSRLDSSTSYAMTAPASAFIVMFNGMTGDRQRKSDKKHYQHESIQFSNLSTCVGFYDQGAKAEHKALPFDWQPLKLEDNRLRYELQKKNGNALTQAYGMKLTFADLPREEVIRKAVELRHRAFFQYFPDNGNGMKYSERRALFMAMHNAKGGGTGVSRARNVRQEFLETIALQACPELLEQMEAWHREMNYTQDHITRVNKKHRAMLATGQQVADLYQEVRQRIEGDLKIVA